MLDGLFVTPAVTAIEEALGTIPGAADGPIAVVGDAKLARALAARREVVAIGMSPRAARQFTDAPPDTRGLAAGSLAAVVGIDVVDDEGWATTLAAWSRVVRDGGAIVLVDRSRGAAAEASRRALCAGLSELAQRHVGRTVVTSGLVTHLDPVG